MYNNQDLDEAVAAGALDAGAAASLRTFLDGDRHAPAVDEEQFRLVTSFNDIFVSIASVILLFAVGWIGQSIARNLGLVMSVDGNDGPSFLGPLAVAITAWGLATFFTGKRRMALPSILLLLAFVGAVFAATCLSIGMVAGAAFFQNSVVATSVVAAVGALVAAVAAFVHWRRFHVPITVAAGSAAIVALVVSLVASALGNNNPNTRTIMLVTVLILGVAMFLFAMRWDASDPARTTRRADVAFWLHLLAAPMIVHPVFTLLGLNDGNATVSEGLVVIALYVVLAIAALAIDRRALLVSALAYVLYALSELFKQVGAVELNVALTALVIGSALLMLSAYWHQARRFVVGHLPGELATRLPYLDRSAIPQPAA